MKHDALIAPDELQFAFTPKISGFAANDGSTDTITVPDAELLFQGTFKRDGDDLKIFGKDGNAFLVDDYFKHDKKPALLSPEGASLSSAVVEALAGPLAAGQYAQAGAQQGATQAIGRVEKAEGSVSVVRNGVTITLNAGDTVMKGDVVQTGAGGSLGIVFSDGTAFNLAANARMILNDFVYNAGGGGNSALISLVQGSISFVAGQVAKTGDMKVETPVATMGIRGTAVLVEIDANNGQTKFSVMVEPNGTTGSFNLYDKSSGALLATVNSSNIGWVVTPVGPLQVIAQQVQKTPAELARELAIVQQVFQTFNTGPFDPNAPQQQQQDPQRRGDNPQGTQTAGSGSSGGVTIDPIKLTGTQTPTGNNQTNNNQTDSTDGPDNTGTDGTGIGDDTPVPEPETTTITANNIYGTNDNDTIEGTAINDFVFAGAGDDTIIAGHGGGNDFYDGDGDGGKGFAGEGYDTIKFESANGVTFDLFGIGELNKASSASTGLDDFINIERIVASPGNDVFNLHGGAWHIEAGDGNDVFNLYGAFQADLDGGEGIDTIFFIGDLDITEDTDGPDIAGFEVIDLNTTGSNTVDLDIEGVIEAIEGNETGYLKIEGTSADLVNLTNDGGEYLDGNWRLAETSDELDEIEGYTLYVFDNDGQIGAEVYIRNDIGTEIVLENEPPTIAVDGPEEILQEDEGGSAQAVVTVSDPDSDVRYVLSNGWTPVDPGLGAQAYNGHYYAFFTFDQGTVTWTDAQNSARANGGDLATITSAAENAFIFGLIDPYTTPGATAVFIGGSDASSEGFWYWSSGLEGIPYFWNEETDAGSYGQYENWREPPFQEPNGGSSENYVVMEGDGTWNDVANGHAGAVGYVIEFSSYRMDGKYGYAIFNTANGTITYHLNNNDADTQALGQDHHVFDTFQIAVNDGDTTVTETVTFAIEGANDAPEVDEDEFKLNIPEQVAAGEEFSFSIGAAAFKDVDAGDSLTYEAVQLVDGHYELELPEWLSFDPVTRTFSGQPGAHDFGEYLIQVRATDEHGAYVTETFTLTVEEPEVENQAPIISIDNAETSDDEDFTILSGLSVTDGDAGTNDLHVTVTAEHGTLTFVSSEGNPIEDGISFDGNIAAVSALLTQGITYTDPAYQEGLTDKVTLTVDDLHGGADTINFIFHVFGEGGATLEGDTGKDVLFSTGGVDTLTGGGLGGDGSDTFVFSVNESTTDQIDAITDFDVSADRIVLDGGTYDDIGDLDITYNESGALIDLGTSGYILLENVEEAQLKANNFVFHPDLQ